MQPLMMCKVCLICACSIARAAAAEGEPRSREFADQGEEVSLDWSAGAISISLARAEPFRESSWFATFMPAASIGDNAGEIYMARAGVGYYFCDDWSINLEAVGAVVKENDDSDVALGGGFDLLLRWHFWHMEPWSLYFDGGAGFIVFDEKFPRLGTEFNFTPQFGVGLTYQFQDRSLLMAGVRFQHISNAEIKGAENNPGYDAALIYAGLMLPF
jgi:hypothetical protein